MRALRAMGMTSEKTVHFFGTIEPSVEAKQEEEHHGMEKQNERMARSTVFAEDAARAFHALLECANGPKATIRLTQNVAWGHISCVLRN